jgi:GTP-binding protein Era
MNNLTENNANAAVPFRSGFVALIGRPNSGKSTLLNTILDQSLSVVTSMPQTTRKNLKGIYTNDNVQLVFVDTPGIHEGSHEFNKAMVRESFSSIGRNHADCLCYLIDTTRELGSEEDFIAGKVRKSKIPTLLLFNKKDICPDIEKVHTTFFSRYPFFSPLPSIDIAAHSSRSRLQFLNILLPMIPEGPAYFPPDDLTDTNLRTFAAEFIRKHVILTTRQEVPHAVFVEILSYKETPRRHRIEAVIHVETRGQRGIIIGKNGSILARIRKCAQTDLSALTGTPSSINIHIKITPKWRNNPRFIKEMGYQ